MHEGEAHSCLYNPCTKGCFSTLQARLYWEGFESWRGQDLLLELCFLRGVPLSPSWTVNFQQSPCSGHRQNALKFSLASVPLILSNYQLKLSGGNWSYCRGKVKREEEKCKSNRWREWSPCGSWHSRRGKHVLTKSGPDSLFHLLCPMPQCTFVVTSHGSSLYPEPYKINDRNLWLVLRVIGTRRS